MRAPSNTLLMEWLARVDDDLGVIENTIRGKFIPNAVAFHAQQASEKMLKIALLLQGVEPPYIHSLDRLVRLFRQDFSLRLEMQALLRFEAMHLNSRYPVEDLTWRPPAVSDAIEWLGLLTRIRHLIYDAIQNAHTKETP